MRANEELLRLAIIDARLGYELTMEQRTMLALQDGAWHSARELSKAVSHRFGGYLHTLKDKGVEWEKRLDPDRPTGKMWWQYRLTPLDRQDNLFD